MQDARHYSTGAAAVIVTAQLRSMNKLRLSGTRPEDLLVALAALPGCGLGHDILVDYGFTPGEIIATVDQHLLETANVRALRYGNVMQAAADFAARNERLEIASEDILFGLTCSYGVIRICLRQYNLTSQALIRHLASLQPIT